MNIGRSENGYVIYMLLEAGEFRNKMLVKAQRIVNMWHGLLKSQTKPS